MFELVVLMKKQTTIDDLQFMQHALKTLKHQEVDDERLYVVEPFMLGFNRLSLMDLNDQVPSIHSTEEGCHLIFYGEVYNDLALRQQLEKLGFECQHSPIGDVILTLYQLIGQTFITQLRGLFSLILYDQALNQLFVVSDSFGIHPLYYTVFEEGIFLSSQLHPFKLNVIQSPADDNLTNLKTVKQLQPRTLLMYSFKQGLTLQPFATVELLPIKKDDHTLKTELQQAFLTSIESSLKRSHEVGCLLTESFSSMTVAACANTLSSHLKTYALCYKENDRDNYGHLLKLADQLKLNLKVKTLTATEFLNEAKVAMQFLGTPITHPSAIALYHLAKVANHEVDILLSGEGVNELWSHHPLNSLKHDHDSSRLLQRLICLLSSIFKNKQIEKLLSFKKHRSFKPSAHPLLMKPPLSSQNDLIAFEELRMAHALKLHLPFLNSTVVELTNRLNHDTSLKNNSIQTVLREAFNDVASFPLLNTYQTPSVIPLKTWLKNELYDEARQILLSERDQPFIDQSKALSYLELHAKGKRDYSNELWPLLMYLLWYDGWGSETGLL